MSRFVYVLCCCVVVSLLASCSDDPEGTPTDRFVYYSVAKQGLHRYAIGTGTDEVISQDNIVWITQVAENGIVLFSTETAGVLRMWGRCEDGSIIPVPMPVAESASEEYVLSSTPPVLSWKGHHAAFVVHKRPLHSTDSASWSAHLCVFDCGAWKLKMGDISSFLVSTLAAQEMTPDAVRVHAVHLTDYGDATALIAHFRANKADGSMIHTCALLAYDAAGFRILEAIPMQNHASLTHVKFDPKTSVVYAFPSWRQPFAVDSRTGDVRDLVIPVIPYCPWTPVAWQTSEFVDVSFPQINLRRIDTGVQTRVIEDAGLVFHSHTDLAHGAGHSPALSPDAAWLGLLWSGTDGRNALFLISRDGSEVRRVTKGAIVAPIVISSEVAK